MGFLEWLTIAAMIGLPFIATTLFQWLWNNTMPELFALPQINYWQGLRLIVMAVILFGSGALLR